MTRNLWKTAPFILLLAGLSAAFACDTSDSDDTSCADACGTTPDCDGTSCLAYCISLRDACGAKGQDSAFSDWASCAPVLSCQSGEYVALTCDLEAIEVLSCGTVTTPLVVGTAGSESSSGIVFVTSSGSHSSGSGSGVETFSESTDDGVDAGDSSSDDTSSDDFGDDGGVDGGEDADAGNF